MAGGDSQKHVAAVTDRASIVGLPKWAPADLVEWLGHAGRKWPARQRNRYIRLITDARMREVWDWHSRARKTATRELYAWSLSFCMDIDRALSLPGKPGDMTKAKRTAYFEQVRKHTRALIKLLAGTRYSSNAATYSGHDTGNLIDNESLAETVVRDLADWGVDEPGHVVAYQVDEDGVSKLPWNYPESELLDLLWEVIEWTHEDDGWDWGFGLSSSKPLERAKGSTVKVVYFTCTLYGTLARQGMKIPFSHLATTANVALNLPASDQLDEDAARKQVRRHEARNRRVKAQTDWAF